MRKTKGAEPVKARAVVRCAIYTRKSTEEGLEQEFNSLDAQREAAEAYVKSQAHEGWICLPDRYDDGGFTGGNMDRPAVRRVLADIEQGKVDAVIAYKVDRLSRSLLDFSKMMEVFATRACSSGVSVGHTTSNPANAARDSSSQRSTAASFLRPSSFSWSPVTAWSNSAGSRPTLPICSTTKASIWPAGIDFEGHWSQPRSG